jgi:class 3 adenylate cyclase
MSKGLSIRLKAALLLTGIAVVPAGAVAWRLSNINRDTVETAERNLQAAVLSEVAGSVLGRIRETEADARAVASALALAAARADDGDAGLGAVRSLMATRRSIDAARFEVPAAHVDTVIRREGTTESDVPRSSEAQRRTADDRGIAFSLVDARTGSVVVPVAKASPAGANGYVTVRVDLGGLSEELRDVGETRFAGGGASLIVVDGARRTVASFGGAPAAPADASALPVWQVIPAGASWSSRVAVVSGFSSQGSAFVGGVESVEQLGWAVALWRPESVAYAALRDSQRQSAWVVALALVSAIVTGLVAGGAVTRPVLRIAQQANLLGQRRWREVELDTKRKDELGDLSRSMQQMARDLESSELEIRREAKLRSDLSRFMSKELVDAIVKGEHSLALGGQKSEITVLFADVVAFTPLAESREAEQVVALLNELFSMLSEVVFRHGGTVDKFIGDCIMAVWGAPVPQADHARRALAAAEDMMRFLEAANPMWQQKFGTELRLAIGVNSGEAIVGNIGSDKRMEYTVVGDVVNVAARLEAVARPNQILVAERTAELAGEGFSLIALGPHQLTGRKRETGVFELALDGADA